MINLQIWLTNGEHVMLYDVHPRSQDEPIPLPADAVSVVVWLGVNPYRLGVK